MSSQNQNRRRSFPENKPSSLLTKEENDLVFSLLGKRCMTLATTVAQLYLTESPSHNRWVKKGCGAVCFVKDSTNRSYYIRLYDIDNRCMVWEQELYIDFRYLSPKSFFHTFEGHFGCFIALQVLNLIWFKPSFYPIGYEKSKMKMISSLFSISCEDCQAGLNFANETEADGFRQNVEMKLRLRSSRKERRDKQRTAQQNGAVNSLSPTSSGITATVAVTPETKKKKKKKRKDEKKKTRITKDLISMPTNFQHVSHVGWDPNKGFDFDLENLDPSLQEFFKQAGVSVNDLKDKRIRDFIYGFLDEHGGVEAAIKSVSSDQENLLSKHLGSLTPEMKRNATAPAVPPPVPARAPPTPNLTRGIAPPAPPARAPTIPPSRVPLQSPAQRQFPPAVPSPKSFPGRSQSGIPPPAPPPPPPPPLSAPPTNLFSAPVPPAPPVADIPLPPPPPPLAPSFTPSGVPAPPPPPPPAGPLSNSSSMSSSLPAVSDNRSALLEAIRSGKSLNRVSEPEKKVASSNNGRGELLNQIQRGIELKKVDESSKKNTPVSKPLEGLAGALAKALNERSHALRSSDESDSDDDDDDDDEDWD
ncbi:Wiskott-Aldrich syndrome protein [Nymphon striatum]|nr:Wiskott-Aldrich syndrome protein [Nymphon striatum]